MVVDERVGLALSAAERRVALLSRCTPLDWPRQFASLLGTWERGYRLEPVFTYEAASGLDEVERELQNLARLLPDSDLAGFQRARIDELLLEIALVESRGTPRFAELAARRFPVIDITPERCLGGDEATTVASTADERVSLAEYLSAEIGRRRLPVRVVERDDLMSVAAAGVDTIFVRRDVRTSVREAERIALHEIEAHVLPRLRARSTNRWSAETGGLLWAGVAGSLEEEEGRALLLEERRGFLGAERRAALLRRHQAARLVRQGARFVDIAVWGLESGLDLESSLRLSARATRGGGLGREVTYLPALFEMRRAFAEQPELEEWFTRGRMTVEFARFLSRCR